MIIGSWWRHIDLSVVEHILTPLFIHLFFQLVWLMPGSVLPIIVVYTYAYVVWYFSKWCCLHLCLCSLLGLWGKDWPWGEYSGTQIFGRVGLGRTKSSAWHSMEAGLSLACRLMRRAREKPFCLNLWLNWEGRKVAKEFDKCYNWGNLRKLRKSKEDIIKLGMIFRAGCACIFRASCLQLWPSRLQNWLVLSSTLMWHIIGTPYQACITGWSRANITEPAGLIYVSWS